MIPLFFRVGYYDLLQHIELSLFFCDVGFSLSALAGVPAFRTPREVPRPPASRALIFSLLALAGVALLLVFWVGFAAIFLTTYRCYVVLS